ncbi:imidazoleglycerol-phosphate dehydratase HisB [Streptomyces sp. NPDC058045]|uniref:imidazoleglycerol-phosphate dehydratase HisB n=1 Tax=Streptomyces sp. NPDC058045 TaxID=3346311 RepID=UPI0036EE4CE1
MPANSPRTARISRATKETSIELELDLDGTGQVDISTGVGFYDHMLTQLGRHGLFDLRIHTRGDLHIDTHHTVEDTAIALGQAFDQALGDRRGVSRYADRSIPLDEALARVVVDVSGRPYLVFTQPEGLAPTIGDYDTTLTQHVWESFAFNARMALHVDVLRGRNAHHVAEAQFKAAARALRDACALDPREPGIPSTKGLL